MSRFTLNFLTLLAVTINVPPGLPVTEAQLARVAPAETAQLPGTIVVLSGSLPDSVTHRTEGGLRV